MKFTTQVPVSANANAIGYHSEIVSLGSCFAENIAEKLQYFQFRSLSNPVGILFHPEAIEKFISLSVSGIIDEDRIFTHNGLWHSFDAHSSNSDPDRERLIASLKRAAEAARSGISAASHMILTYGTAWVYRETASGKTVANCHKLPQANFTKALLPVDDIYGSVIRTIELIRSINPLVHIIFTISPVRHLKDGFTENQRSKSSLVLGLHNAISNQENATYFPSYEIMMDELRDYRFYADDLLHPSRLAIEHIWERFADAWLSAEAKPIMELIDSIRKDLSHRPLHRDSTPYRNFTKSIDEKISALRKIHPHINF